MDLKFDYLTLKYGILLEAFIIVCVHFHILLPTASLPLSHLATPNPRCGHIYSVWTQFIPSILFIF